MESKTVPELRFPGFDEDWEEKKIEDLCESIIDCVNKTAPIVDGITPYKMIRTANVRNGRVDLSSVSYVSKDTYNIWNRRGQPQKGDLIFTREAPVGEFGILEEDEGVFLGQRTMMYRVDETKSVNTYLLNVLQTRYCKRQIDGYSHGGTVAHMRVPDCGLIKIPLGTLHEQTKIANFLTSVDKRIDLLQQKRTELERYKKGVMQKLFTVVETQDLASLPALRFKKDDGSDFPDWEEKKLGQMTKIYDGTHQTPKYVEKGVPFYSVEHVTANQFSKTKFISESVFEKEKQRVKLEYGDILMTRIGSIGVVKHIDWKVNASFYVSLALIKANDTFNSRYLSYALQHSSFQRELWKRTIHVAFPQKINLGEIGECKVLIPQSIIEQKKIADFLSSIDRKIEKLTDQIDDSVEFKRGLLQKMFV